MEIVTFPYDILKISQNVQTYFYALHLVKNITGNLLNSEKVVLSAFEFSDFNVQCPDVYIKWRDIQKINDFYQNLQSYLKKALKLLYQALHPGKNKQNVLIARFSI